MSVYVFFIVFAVWMKTEGERANGCQCSGIVLTFSQLPIPRCLDRNIHKGLDSRISWDIYIYIFLSITVGCCVRSRTATSSCATVNFVVTFKAVQVASTRYAFAQQRDIGLYREVTPHSWWTKYSIIFLPHPYITSSPNFKFWMLLAIALGSLSFGSLFSCYEYLVSVKAFQIK